MGFLQASLVVLSLLLRSFLSCRWRRRWSLLLMTKQGRCAMVQAYRGRFSSNTRTRSKSGSICGHPSQQSSGQVCYFFVRIWTRLTAQGTVNRSSWLAGTGYLFGLTMLSLPLNALFGSPPCHRDAGELCFEQSRWSEPSSSNINHLMWGPPLSPIRFGW